MKKFLMGSPIFLVAYLPTKMAAILFYGVFEVNYKAYLLNGLDIYLPQVYMGIPMVIGLLRDINLIPVKKEVIID